MEYQYHELSYMKASFEHTQVKEDIENLLREWHIIDQKLESKTREQNELYEKCMRHMRVLRKKGMMGDLYCPKKRGIAATPTKVYDGRYVSNYIPLYRHYTPPKAQAVTNAAQGSFWSPVQTGHLTESTILPAGGLVQNYPLGTPSGQFDQSIHQHTIAQPSKVPCSFGTLKSDLTDEEMIEYANKNIEHESKDNTGSIDNNQKSSSSKQNDQVHKGSPKKSKSDDESSSELNPEKNDQVHKGSPKKSKSDDESSELNAEQALEYVSQDSEDESKIKPNTTDDNQKSCSSKHNDQSHESSPKKSQFDGGKCTDVKEGKRNCEIDEKSALTAEKGNISGMEQKKCNLNSRKDRGANSEELMPKMKTHVSSDIRVVRRQIFKNE